MDQMGEVEYAPGEPKGTPWHPHRGFETVTYMIDGDLRAPRLQRRRRHDHRRRHPVDDRRRRRAAHRDAAGAPGGQRRALPRLPAVGQPAQGAEDGRPALPGHPRRRGRAALQPPTAARCCGSSPASVDGPRRAGRHLHPDQPGARDAQPGRARSPALGARASTPWSTCWPAAARVGRRGAARSHTGQLAVFGPGDAITVAADSGAGEPQPPTSTCSSSAAGRSASRSPRTARS